MDWRETGKQVLKDFIFALLMVLLASGGAFLVMSAAIGG